MFRLAQPQFQPKPQAARQGFSTTQRQVIQCPDTFQTLTARNQNAQHTQSAQNPIPSERKCYACGERGHYAKQCPNPRTHPPQIVVSTLAVPVEPTLFLLLLSRTIPMVESTMFIWRKPRKLRAFSLVCFSSMTLL
jgi:hypothetical protein